MEVFEENLLKRSESPPPETFLFEKCRNQGDVLKKLVQLKIISESESKGKAPSRRG